MTSVPERTPERLRSHYEVEKALADRLKATRSPSERAAMYATMYDELFRRVPDHPRLTRAFDPAAERRTVDRLLALLRPHLAPHVEYVEFGAGTCALAFAAAAGVRRVRVVEIADQIPKSAERPHNFELVLYDGWNLAIPDDSVDVVFSEQFLEHLHPDDARHHLDLVHRMLRAGGVYVLRTPERLTGPHDISRFFSDTPQGFHLHEWTYATLAAAARAAGFRHLHGYWNARGKRIAVPFGVFMAAERGIATLPRRLRRGLGHRLIPMVTAVLEK